MGSQASKGQMYNQEIPGSKQPGFSSIYRKIGANQLIQAPQKDLHSLRQILKLIKGRYGKQRGIGQILVKKVKLNPGQQNYKQGQQGEERSLIEHTYNEVYDISYDLGKILYQKRLFYEEKQMNMKLIGIYSKNSYQWYITDWACIHFGITTVPLYDTLGVANLTYCLKQTELTTLFVSAATLKTLLTLTDFGNLKTLICYDKIDSQTAATVQKANLELIDYYQLLKLGSKSSISNQQIKIGPNDIYTFSYTSGTTGPPKGALLSHGNLLSCMASFNLHQDIKLTSEDRYLSYLPLPHVMQRLIANYNFYKGVYLIVSTGNMLKLKDDCLIAKPSLFISVPRIFNKIVQAVKAKFALQTGCKKMLIDKAVKSKAEQIQNNGEYEHCLYDKLIFSKVKAGFGGNIRVMASGSAPLSGEVQKFMKIIMACPMIEGYGQTQNTAGCLFSRALQKDGYLCEISAGLQIKLANIPQMKYTSQDKDQETGLPLPRGQLWVRGPQIFKGYYKLPEVTRQTINADGWLQTGDVVQIMDGGKALKIIDRKKNIFKLQQGEYVAPDKVQNVYSKCNLVSEIFLHGDSHQNFAVAIATPNKDNLIKYAGQKNIKGTYEQICQSRQMRILVLKQLNLIGRSKQSGLHGFELAKNIHLEANGFAPRNILTNTMKLVRFQAKKSFAPEIQKLYKQGELSDK